jgi:hypothetical protein
MNLNLDLDLAKNPKQANTALNFLPFLQKLAYNNSNYCWQSAFQLQWIICYTAAMWKANFLWPYHDGENCIYIYILIDSRSWFLGLEYKSKPFSPGYQVTSTWASGFLYGLPGAIHWNAFIILGGGFFKQRCKGVGNHLSGTWNLLNNLVWWSSQCCPPNGQTGHPPQQLFLGLGMPTWNPWNIIPVCIIGNLDSTDSVLQCFKCSTNYRSLQSLGHPQLWVHLLEWDHIVHKKC